MFCRQVGTIAYRSGPEWEQRFGQRRRDPDTVPDFCQDFEIEHYLLRQVERELILFGTLRN
jgi:homoserine acetyltransferase